MLIQIPVYGSEESVTMIPYELTFPLCVVEEKLIVNFYRMLDEVEILEVQEWNDGNITVSITPHSFLEVENGLQNKEYSFSEDCFKDDFFGDKMKKIELLEIGNLLKRFAVLLHNKIDKISTNPNPF